MSRSHDRERLPGELQELADALRERRPELGPLELDRIKLRAMRTARSGSPRRVGLSARSRLVAFLTVGVLALTGGSALAGYNYGGWGGGYSGEFENEQQSAAWHQYRPPCQQGYSFGNDGHCHPGPPHHHFRFTHGYCWIENNRGGWSWGYGYGWTEAED